ncbi:hypothetical protein DL769_001820 [Monosporascus sp. CRB-8-3]|nr:hypothetical protein DL769_001820 [Monosporascus sp. CRB-8-3]
MDPQQRLLLETVYEALEAGGHTVEGLRGSDTAVYTGTMGVDYNDTGVRDLNTVPTYFATGVNRAIISNRVSYFFDWHGPSMTIDTACSSSLVAVHQGVKTLRSGESRVALACGTQVILNPEMYVIESKLKMLSPTGRSRMWDADADGYARGEGVAVIVLKRLSDAVADGDHIECIIRETGSNQDGHSNGITVPSTEAQAALIRRTYATAGLDPENNPHDRPQFFEAHGTGTKAGDPKEAAAIYQSFGRHIIADEAAAPLYVGSVKTVIGHLEGSAGLAGLLKGSASIQRGLIAPNLLFNRLNPDIEPFYKGLEVPTRLTSWPDLPEGVPRRVSVNSFGFGGSNAHAILEQYVRPNETLASRRDSFLTPFVFSAASEVSLIAQLRAYAHYLKEHDDLNASDLAWTLQARRSQLPMRVALSAVTIERLTAKIDAKLAAVEQNPGTTIGIRASSRSSSSAPRILGVFTGQGAQWPTMGAELIRASDFVRQRLRDLEQSLATLPSADRPSWSLQDEIRAGANTSRIAEAALSQPLCTAIQIVLVDLLQAAGITFSAVVGHSSGEIAAAYAAGFLSARDAIRVAYYRGLHARLAGSGSTGQKGAMLAVGTSLDDAQELTSLRAFRGRVAVAAHNSSASVTLSGDADAVVHAMKVFGEEKKFTRLLKVDTAYHSHHMLPCGEPYIASLRGAGVRLNRERNTACPPWFSSVIPSEKAMEPTEALQDVYWRDNMTSAVLFADAIKNAVASDDQIGLVLEVGPHPALKGPATQNITDVLQTTLPYSGVLHRQANDIEAFSDALGFLWTHLGSQSVDFQSITNAMSCEPAQPHLVVGLPSYQWNHGRSHWNESRRSRKLRSQKQPLHELLGTLAPESNAHDLRWNNVLKVSEVPWLDGHQLQGQTVFPAAGYVVMALEASRSLAADKEVQLFELHDLSIPRAMTFEEGDNSGVETLVTLTEVRHHRDQTVTANFSTYSLPVVGTGSEQEMELMATATVKIVFGTPSVDALVCEPLEDYNMYPIDTDRFYSNLRKLGYGYSGPFQTISSLKRRLGHALGFVGSYTYTEADPSKYLMHPSTLDVAFQAAMLAYSAPGDERLWSLHVPTAIRRIRLNPQVCASLPTSGCQVPVCATIDNASEKFSASIDLLSRNGEQGMMQIEDLTIKTFAPATDADDRVVFTSTKFGPAVPDGTAVAEGIRPTAHEAELAIACERMAYYYLRKWDAELSDEQWANGQPHHKYLRDWVNRTLSIAISGNHPTLKSEWSEDTPEDIEELARTYAGDLDVKMISVVGQNIPAAVRGETTILEHLLRDNMLDDFYKVGSGFQRYNWFLAGMMKQISHRYPNTKIFEIGAGTGGATKSVLDEIGDSMSSYTYTDISVGFFSKAAELFKAHSDKMTFKVFDVEKPPASQGYEPYSYDVVIASNVLHATESLHATLSNTRKLLKPGGYLLLLEITNNVPIRTGFIWGTLAGWWLGVNDGRRWAPTISPGLWHSALRKAGFAGVDAVTPEIDGVAWPFSIMASQAVDDRVQFLRRPLSASTSAISIDSLVILGNGTLETARIAEELADHLGRFCRELTILDSLPTETESLDLSPMSTFINLVDLDSPIFQGITSEKLDGLKRMLDLARHVLWVTQGALYDQPYQMASIAFSRAVRREAGHISLNHLDLSDVEQQNDSKYIAEHLLQLYALDAWETPGAGDGQDRHQQLFWSKEPEVFLNKGKLSLPRLRSNIDQNARLNSSRRVITKTLPVAGSNVVISPASPTSPPSLIEPVSLTTRNRHPSDTMKPYSSSLMALGITADTFLFLAMGSDKATGKLVALLSRTNSRQMIPVASVLTDIEAASNGLIGSIDNLLVATASELLAESVIQSLSSGCHILINCAGKDRFLAAALSRRAQSKMIRVTFTYDEDNSSDVREPTWIALSARAPKHTMRRIIQQAKPTHFLDLTAANYTSGDRSKSSNLHIDQVLPARCKRIDPFSLFQNQSSLPMSYDQKALVGRLQEAVSGVKSSAAMPTSRRDVQDMVIQLSQLGEPATSYHTTSVVHWPSDGHVKVEVRPLDAGDFFSGDKTYLLVGLSGKIGQSLAEWMISNGAGCVCLTSRHPVIDERWMESFRGTGATVKVYPMDVTDMRSVESVVKDIRASCPPIAGVANGAMVLNDVLFSKMPTDKMQQVLQPKIEGSNNLDRVFYNDDLDFFVLFSSASCVVGNLGQSNYAAANGYINSLARQRRRRGLAASSFDIGQVAGIGYIETAGQVVMDQLATLGLRPLSETDLRQAFAETIRSGYLPPTTEDAIPDVVLTTGIRHFSEEEDIKGPWFSNPFFSHCVINSKVSESESEQQDRRTTLPAARQLAKATTKEQALEILQECFAAKLRVVLQLADQLIDHDAPLVELGIDSLVAVEVRSWFLKEVKVDIPVLKVVGGASLAELCQRALEKLPDELLPSLGKKKAGIRKPDPAPQPLSRKSLLQVPLPSEDSGSSSTSEYNSTPAETPGTPLSGRDGAASSMSEASTRSASPSEGSRDLKKKSLSSKPTSYFPPQPVPLPTSAPAETVAAPLPPRRFLKSVPISFGQSRFWFLQQLLENQRTHNVAYYYHVKGNLDVGDMQRAVRIVTSRHESLRTCFIKDDADAAQAYQKVLPNAPIRLECKNINSLDDVATEYKMLRTRHLDLASGNLLNLVLLTRSPSEHYLLVYHHHIIMDGVSLQVFLSDLEKAYNGGSLGGPPRQYPDFSVAQRRAFENGEMSDELRYWQRVFPAGQQPPVLPLLPMAKVSSRMPMTEYDTHQVQWRLEPTVATKIRSVSKAQGCTPFHLYLAAFKAMLFRLADIDDLTIGVADAARNDGDVMGSIGFFLNLLTLRFQRQPDQSFKDAITEARKRSHAAQENSRLPFDVLLTELGVSRSSTHSPLFQAFIDYRQGLQERQQFGNCQLEMQEEVHTGKTGYDVTVDVTESETDAVIMIRAQKSLYDLTATNLLCETYVHFLDALTKDPSLPLSDTPLFSEKQLTHAVQIGRGPTLISDWPETLPQRIDQVALGNQDKIALVDGIGRDLTYRAMSNRIEAIAEALQDAGVGDGLRVLVFQQASSDWPCSMLAIMRLGAVYVPLDLRNPIPRLAAVAKDCEPTAILVDATTLADVPRLGIPYTTIVDVSDLGPEPSARIAVRARPDCPAAILYTSGSTGTPKGVVVTHAGLRNEIEGYTKMWNLGAERVLQQSAFTFNHQMYTGLVNGGAVYIVPWDKRGNPLEITAIIRQHAITYTKATPSEYALWMQYGCDNLRQATAWRYAFGGGEPLTNVVTQEFAGLGLPQLRVFNSYGPTEISISSTKMEIAYRDQEAMENVGRIPCGYSLPNYYTYVVDEHMNPLPAGMPGELCIGGAGVSLGYLNNQEMTSRYFVNNPFASREDTARGLTRMYRTGDIGHLTQDGAMVFHSRIAGDTQVKIRGLRIELSDIESNLVAAANGVLREAVVTLRQGDPDFLVAHVLFAVQHTITDKEAFLKQLLGNLPVPQYMVPVAAIPLDALPLTNHSKVDRKLVQNMPLPKRIANFDEETELTETMMQLKGLWQDVLGKSIKDLGFEFTPSTNFFLVGGNSLLVIRLQARIREAFKVAMPLVDLLGANTLGQMARKIEETASVNLIDWEQETAPPAVPSFLSSLSAAVPREETPKAKTILVTGATGFLAKYILPQLVIRPDVHSIHCVAVRDPKRLPTSSKVVAHVGNLSAPLLGLSQHEFHTLSSQADVILHMGGTRSFWDSYNVLRPSNVHSTKELVKLAAPQHVPIHYISTGNVLRQQTGTPADTASSVDFIPPTDGTDGYTASRWASERILERSQIPLCVPASIHRFLPAVEQEHAPQEVLDEFIRLIDITGYLPDTSGWAGRLDMIPAEDVARRICQSLLDREMPLGTVFMHYESRITVSASELTECVERYKGRREGLNRIPLLKWIGCIKKAGFKYLLASHEATMEKSAEDGLYNLQCKNAIFPSFWPAFTEVLYPASAHVLDALERYPEATSLVRTGFNFAFDTVDEEPMFATLGKNAKRAKRVGQAMSSLASGEGYEISYLVDGCDFSDVDARGGTFADVGGSHGFVCVGLAERYRNMRLVVQDLPKTVVNAPDPICEDAQVVERITFVAHDFFTRRPVRGANVYFFRWIMHNHSIPYAFRILRNLSPALKPGARVVINDHSLRELAAKNPWDERLMRSMDLAMMTLLNVQEPNEEEFRALFKFASESFVVKLAFLLLTLYSLSCGIALFSLWVPGAILDFILFGWVVMLDSMVSLRDFEVNFHNFIYIMSSVGENGANSVKG